MKPRTRSKKSLKHELWELCKKYIRARDKFTCQKCRKELAPAQCHTSHVVPKSHGNILRYDHQNLKVLCYSCHKGWWHANPTESGLWFKFKFPDRWDYIQAKKEQICKLGIFELNELIDEYGDLLIGQEMSGS